MKKIILFFAIIGLVNYQININASNNETDQKRSQKTLLDFYKVQIQNLQNVIDFTKEHNMKPIVENPPIEKAIESSIIEFKKRIPNINEDDIKEITNALRDAEKSYKLW